MTFKSNGLKLNEAVGRGVALGDLNGDGLPDLFFVDLRVDFKAPPEKWMQRRCAEVRLSSK